MAVKAVPEGFQTITPYLVVPDAAALIDFLRRAFGAEETHRTKRPDGSIMHAQVKIGSSMLMMSSATPQWPARPSGLYLYVEDADRWHQRAIEAGATSVLEPMDAFWGDRMAVYLTWPAITGGSPRTARTCPRTKSLVAPQPSSRAAPSRPAIRAPSSGALRNQRGRPSRSAAIVAA
jgi:PhnB protein